VSAKAGLRIAGLGYLVLLLALPVAMIFFRTFEHGLGAVWEKLTEPAALHALWLTLLMVAIAVPLNTVFGVACAFVLVRQRFRGRRLLDAVLDLPFAISPVVVGLALFLLYGRTGWFGSWLAAHGIQVIFSPVGMVLATVFVSLPFVAREVAPVLREIGTEQEDAAATLGASRWQTFWRVTLPAIRWGVGYGVVLTVARALGEFGAVSVVSGRLANQTETLPLLVQARYEDFDTVGAYAASALLAALALFALLVITRAGRRRGAPSMDLSPTRGATA
jgi:sulfate transport system permease protein